MESNERRKLRPEAQDVIMAAASHVIAPHEAISAPVFLVNVCRDAEILMTVAAFVIQADFDDGFFFFVFRKNGDRVTKV
jgi:hypothetical protein